MKYHALFFSKIEKDVFLYMSQNLSSAAVVIGALRVKASITTAAGDKIWVTFLSFWEVKPCYIQLILYNCEAFCFLKM